MPCLLHRRAGHLHLDAQHLDAQIHRPIHQTASVKAPFHSGGDLGEQALRHAEQILDYLDAKGPLTSEVDPLRVYLTCYQVLAAVGNERAPQILQTTHRKLQQRAANIDDEALRRSFLENIPANQEILCQIGRPPSGDLSIA